MKIVAKHLSFFFLIVAFGCSSKTETVQEAIVEEPETIVEESKETPAVCVWDKLSVRNTPGEKGKWITSISLGESLKHLGGDTTVGNKTYAKIALNDGQEGWTRTDLIVLNAKPAVMINDTDIYNRPDLLTKSDKKFSMMNIVASMNTQDTWNEVKGKRSEGKWIDQGWVKGNNLSFEPVDIATAKFALKAIEIEDEDKKLEALNDIINNGDLSSSSFIAHIQLLVQDMETAEQEIIEDDITENYTETDSIE